MGAAKFEITRGNARFAVSHSSQRPSRLGIAHQDVLKLHLSAGKMKRKEMSVWML